MKNTESECFRVLAVDDEEPVLKIYRDVLLNKSENREDLSETPDLETEHLRKTKPKTKSKVFFELTTCHQGDEAIASVKKAVEEDNPFALVLLGINISTGPNDVRTAEAIRAQDPMIEILLVAGSPDFDPTEIAERISPPHKLLYIQKPFHPREIYQLVLTLCSKWKDEAFIKNQNRKLISYIDDQTEELNKVNMELQEEIRIREESEIALRESEKKFRDLFEKSSDYIFIHDLSGNLISSNLAFKSEYGYDENYLHLRNIKDLIPVRYRDKFKEYLKRIIEKGHDEDIMVLMTKGGSELVLEYKSTLIHDAKGKPVAVRGAGRDISERLKIEEQKHILEIQLTRMLRMEAIGTLAGGIAHNFNNLLMGILGNASLASLEIDSNHQLQRNLENIKTLVESGSRLTRQLLEYSKGGEIHDGQRVDLSVLTRKTAETIGLTRKDINIHYQLDDACNIDADRGQIEQVLLNLIINAADAMPAGGYLFLETKNISHQEIINKPFKVKEGDYVRLIFRDTGSGIDEETLEHIFEPFYTTKGLVRGTGLGLSSVYGIIKAHGGYIEVSSKKGEGTSFTIHLPASAKIPIKEEPEGQEILYGNETILLVDDEKIVLETTEKLLNYLGYSVIKAQGGREALDIFRANRDAIDVVILDLVMPELGGELVFDALVEMKKDVKVILTSGYSLDGKAQEVINRGCKGFIHKPFDIKDLSLKLKEVLKNPAAV